MFAQKLSNPFLKPSPFLTANLQPTLSYNSALPPTPRYNNLSNNSYEQPKPTNYPNFQQKTYRNPQVSFSSKSRETPNINQILTNNPFSRPSNTLFSSSISNADRSPNKYNNARTNNLSPKPTYYSTSNNYNSYTNKYQIGLPERQKNTYTNKLSYDKPLIQQKKFDNYLTASSAQSAQTYINKIYELDAEKSIENLNTPISNPFFRKSLIPDRIQEEQSKYKNSYDSATLKYSYQSEQKLQKPYYQSNYIKQPYKDYKYTSLDNKKIEQNSQINNYDYEKFTGLSQIDNKYSFNKNQRKDNLYSANPYLQNDQEPNKYKKYYQGFEEQNTYQNNFKHNKNQQKLYKVQDKYTNQTNQQNLLNNYYKKYADPLLSNINQQDINAAPKFEKDNKYNFKSTQAISNPYDRQINLNKKGSLKDITQQNRQQSHDKVNFNEDSKQSYKYYEDQSGPFQTLGKINKNSTSWQNKQPYKFKQSEVQEYKYPKQLQDIVPSKKHIDYQYPKQQKNKPKSQHKIISFTEDEQDQADTPVKETNSQQSLQKYPSVLEIAGLRFYKIEIG